MTYFLILFAMLLRVLPHPPNFTSVGAVAMFSGSKSPRWMSYGITILGVLLTDWLIGFDSWNGRIVVYSAFLLYGLIGYALRNRIGFLSIIGGATLGSLLFFLITNCVWLYPEGMYMHTWADQMRSYANALPFAWNMLYADVGYSLILYGSCELARNRSTALLTSR